MARPKLQNREQRHQDYCDMNRKTLRESFVKTEKVTLHCIRYEDFQ